MSKKRYFYSLALVFCIFFVFPINLQQVIAMNYSDSSSLIISEKTKYIPLNQNSVTPDITKDLSKELASYRSGIEEIDYARDIEEMENEGIIQDNLDSKSVIEQNKKPLATISSTENFKSNYRKIRNRRIKRKVTRRRTKALIKNYDKQYAKRLRTLKKLRFRRFYRDRPNAMLSKNYWIFRLYPNKVLEEAAESDNFNKYIKEFNSTFAKSQSKSLKPVRLQSKQRKWTVLNEVHDVYAGKYDPEKRKTPEKIVNPENNLKKYGRFFKPYYQFSWTNLIKYGPTLKEIEVFMWTVTILRVFVYSYWYNIKIGLKIAFIGLYSAYVYLALIQEVNVYAWRRMQGQPYFFRLMMETYLAKRKRSDYEYFNDYPPKTTKKVVYNPYKILRKKFLRSEWYNQNITYSKFLEKRWILEIKGIYWLLYKQYRFLFKLLFINVKQSETIFTFAAFTRAGKDLIPYHIQWHVSSAWAIRFVHDVILWPTFTRSLNFLWYTLIPEGRLGEARFLIDYNAILLGGLIYTYTIMLLHALFSQYFFMPALIWGIENHIGSRPKDDVTSGGYTSWQDSIDLYSGKPKTLKLWFGWLGKGPNDKNRRRKRRNKRRKRR